MTASRARFGAPVVGLGMLVVVVATAAARARGSSNYVPVHLNDPGWSTTLTSAALQATALLTGAVCVGRWVQVGFLRGRSGGDREIIGRHGELLPCLYWGLAWALSSTCLVWVDAADAAGEPLSQLSQSGAFGVLVDANYLPRAWIVTAVCAWCLVGFAAWGARWSLSFAAVGLGVVAVLAPVVVTQVLVGPDHDYGGDAAIIGTPAFTVFVGTAICGALWPPSGPWAGLEQQRTRHLMLAAGAVTLMTDIVIGWFELPGQAPWSARTGQLLLTRDLTVILGAASMLRKTPNARLQWCAATVSLVALGATAIAFRIPSPQYFAPTSISQNFFGFSVTADPSVLRLMTAWRINLLFLVLSTAAVTCYLSAVVRLHRRRDRWPVGRTIGWCLGWLVIVLSTCSGVGRYAGASFSIHMGFHMATNMLGPLLMVLGAPVTLFLRASTAHPKSSPAGPHEWITTALHSGFLRWVYHPAEVFIVMVGSYYVLYFTPLFEDSLRFHWAHQLAYLHFIIAGYMFYGLIIGIDRAPRDLPYLARLAMVLAAMPFHAFFGVLIMTRSGVIAQTFYRYIDAPWMTHLGHDQYVGGGIAWAAGEFPLIIVVLVMVVQWARQDSRESRRFDRRTDAHQDDSFASYNDFLAQLARRSQQPSNPAQQTSRTDPSEVTKP